MLFFKSEFFSDYEFAIRKIFNPKKFPNPRKIFYSKTNSNSKIFLTPKIFYSKILKYF